MRIPAIGAAARGDRIGNIHGESYQGAKALKGAGMKKMPLRMLTTGAFVLAGVIAAVRSSWRAPVVPYGHNEVTVNTLLLLFFAGYALCVSAGYYVRCGDSWIAGDADRWGWLFIAHGMAMLLAAALGLLSRFGPMVGTVWTAASFPAGAFLFAAGIVLLCVGFRGIGNRRQSSVPYVLVTYIMAALFIVLGAMPALLVFVWLMGGGMNIA